MRLRLARTGRKNRPFYRIGAYDARTRRNGRPIELLGWYDPFVREFEKGVEIDVARARHWIEHGAKCSDTVASFLKRKGEVLPRNVRKSGPRTKGKAAPAREKAAGGEA